MLVRRPLGYELVRHGGLPTSDPDRLAEPTETGTASADPQALAPLLQQPFSPLALKVRRVTSAVVGRPVELTAIQQELAAAKSGRLAATTVEGEPGIGKTRLLLAASDIAAAQGFTTVAVAADEEIRGPFLLARSIVGSPEAVSAVEGTAARDALGRSLDALTGQDEPGFESFPPDEKLLRTLDLAAVAVRSLAEAKPLAILIDDLQWADDDSLRLVRYVVRSAGTTPIFLMFAIRPEELAFVNEAVNLLADMERLGLVRRLKLVRFTQVETAEFLGHLLGGKVDPAGAAVMHAQAEGVPFVVEELARAYRDAGMIQEIDGLWTVSKNAERLVPSSVRTLISRRAARLPEETKATLAVAAVLGRHFSLKDLQALPIQLGEEEATFETLDENLRPAVTAGLLTQHAQDSPADYGFAHEQVREFAAARPSTCSVGRANGWKHWPSWRRWRRRSATRAWRPRCSCDELPRFEPPRNGSRQPTWPDGSGTWPRPEVTRTRSSRPPSSWARASCGARSGRGTPSHSSTWMPTARRKPTGERRSWPRSSGTMPAWRQPRGSSARSRSPRSGASSWSGISPGRDPRSNR